MPPASPLAASDRVFDPSWHRTSRDQQGEGGARRFCGSTTVTANSSGTRTGEIRYKAYGASRYTYGTTPTTYHFTGQREESTIGLYYYGARWYDPALGRFVQADVIVPDLANPQDLNRYSYCRGNPLTYIDPSGRIAIPVIIAAAIGIAKAIDYAWTAYDAWQSGRVLADPQASRGDKLLAGLNISLSVAFEALEPDELLPASVPLDDVGRRAFVKAAKEAYEEGGEEALQRFVKDKLGDQADEALQRLGKISGNLPADAASIGDALSKLPRGKQSHVRLVDSVDELDSLFAQLSKGGTPVEGTSFPGSFFELPDGSTIGRRSGSRSGGPAIDIVLPGGVERKVHVK